MIRRARTGFLEAFLITAVLTVLGLVFDPRYRDFPYAALTGALFPFLVMITSRPRLKLVVPGAESVPVESRPVSYRLENAQALPPIQPDLRIARSLAV